MRSVYPVNITELTPSEWVLITEILHIEKTRRSKYAIQELIDDLPSNLSRHFVMQLVPNFIVPAAKLCEVHRGMNPHVVSHIFELVQWEVGFHLDIMLDYPGYKEETAEELKGVIKNLRAVQGMWTREDEDLDPDEMPEEGAWEFQGNKCEACMLARVGAQTETLRELRITLLSRTRTRKAHRVPRLVPFVEGCINHHQDSLEVFHVSSELAFAFKTARKTAVKHYLRHRRACRESRQSKPRQTQMRHESAALRLLRVPKGNDDEDEEEEEDDDDDDETGSEASTRSEPDNALPEHHFETTGKTRKAQFRRWLGSEPQWLKGDRESQLSPKPHEATLCAGTRVKPRPRPRANEQPPPQTPRPNYSIEHLYQDDHGHDKEQKEEDDDEKEEQKENLHIPPPLTIPLENSENNEQVRDTVDSTSEISSEHPSPSPYPFEPPPAYSQSQYPSSSHLSIDDTNQPTQGAGGNNPRTLIPDPLFSERKPAFASEPSIAERKGSMSSEAFSNWNGESDFGDFGDDALSDVDDDESMRSVSPPPVEDIKKVVESSWRSAGPKTDNPI